MYVKAKYVHSTQNNESINNATRAGMIFLAYACLWLSICVPVCVHVCVCVDGCVLFVDYINAIEMHLRGIEIEIEVEIEIA